MDLLSLVDFVNKNAFRLTEMIAEEILLIDAEPGTSVDDRLYALAMFYRAAILDLETKAARGPVQ